MRTLAMLLVALLVLGLLAFGGLRWWQASLLPPVSTEVALVTPQVQARLLQLRAEHKFQPNDYSPFDYTGTEAPDEEAKAVAAVDAVINGVLAHRQGSVTAKKVSALIGENMRKVNLLPTEDRDRTAGYMIEIWYILGFKGATGRFAYGSAYPKPPGYAEPLPPGWKSPTEPRPIA
jgi:hypothetical protein